MIYRSAGLFVRSIILLLLTVFFIFIQDQIAHPNLRLLNTVLSVLLLIVVARILYKRVLFILRPTATMLAGRIRRGTDAWEPTIIIDDTLALHISTRRWKRLPVSFPGAYRVYYGPDAHLLSLEPEEGSGV